MNPNDVFKSNLAWDFTETMSYWPVCLLTWRNFWTSIEKHLAKLFYDILVTILLKIIYPSLLRQKYFLLLNVNRDNPGFPTPKLWELQKPGNSSCWGCRVQGIVPIPESKPELWAFWCLSGLSGSRTQWGSRCRDSGFVLRTNDHPRRRRSDKRREIQRRWRESRKHGVRRSCQDALYPLLV